jgi:RES domain-containing protein
VRFYRIARAKYKTPALTFSGDSAIKYFHRWNRAASDLRAVYLSDSLALACMETLVHIRPLPRVFPKSVYYVVDIPDRFLWRPALKELPPDWDIEPVPTGPMDFGTNFLRGLTAVGLVVPTVLQPIGDNVLLNPAHPDFDLRWITGPSDYPYNPRLE